jgi:hypothetical protein
MQAIYRYFAFSTLWLNLQFLRNLLDVGAVVLKRMTPVDFQNWLQTWLLKGQDFDSRRPEYRARVLAWHRALLAALAGLPADTQSAVAHLLHVLRQYAQDVDEGRYPADKAHILHFRISQALDRTPQEIADGPPPE